MDHMAVVEKTRGSGDAPLGDPFNSCLEVTWLLQRKLLVRGYTLGRDAK